MSEVDLKRLSKDYTGYKWAFKEKAPREDLEYLYVTCKLPQEEIARILNCSKTTLGRWITFYNIRKPCVKVDSAPLTDDILSQIDWSKVSRNYLEQPWKKTDKPVKEDFEYFYITLNWSVSDIAQLLGRSRSQTQFILRKLEISKPSDLHQQSREKMNLRNHGTKFANATPEALFKKEQTNLKKYGVRSLLCNKDFKEESMLKKYGVKHALESEQFMEKMRNTNKENWGVEYTTQNHEVQEKIKSTLKKKYNADNVFKLPEFQNKATKTLLNKYNVPTFAQMHIEHLDDLNKEFWLNNFYDKKRDTFDTEKCADYHNTTLCTVGKWLKKFNITARTKGSSVNEHNIKRFIESFGYTTQKHDRFLIKPLEIDILAPEAKLGIEFDGLAFHSNGLSKCALDDKDYPPMYHYNKTKLCNEKGFQLFHIFENEWVDKNKRAIWKSMIQNKLNKSGRIYARKTDVVELNNAEAKQFCNENHLQGGIDCSVNTGLKYDNELVAVMTFNKPRFNKDYDWELIRYCCKKCTTIIGGASKLFKYFRSTYKGSVISYANLRWSNGGLYEKLGFKLLRRTEPNYFYFKVKNGILPKDYILHSRVKFQKHKLSKLLESFNPELSEKTNMFLNGYRLIYDCGNLVYVVDK